MQLWMNTLKDMLNLLFSPVRTFRDIKPKPVTLRPLWLAASLLFCSNSLSMTLMRSRGHHILTDPKLWPEFDGKLNLLRQAQAIPSGQLYTTLALSPFVSIFTVAVLMYVLSAVLKTGTSFKQNLVLTAYSWGPMILVSVLTTLLIIFLPIKKTLFSSSFFDLIFPVSFRGGMLYSIFQTADPFYLWALFLLASGAVVMYGKGKMRWYIAVFMLFGLPVLLGVLGIVFSSIA